MGGKRSCPFGLREFGPLRCGAGWCMVWGKADSGDNVGKIWRPGGIEKLRAVQSLNMRDDQGPGGEMPVVSYAKRPK